MSGPKGGKWHENTFVCIGYCLFLKEPASGNPVVKRYTLK